ncbi:MAG: DNA repair protein RecO [Candidatus Saccharimonadales bacterium]
MNHCKTVGIVISRVNYGEADRIVTVLTPDYGKVSLMVKGARRAKSKLAGGVELFSVSEIVFMQGKSSLHTLVSARLERHYGHITADLSRTMYGYEVLKAVHKITEENAEPAYYSLLQQVLGALDNFSVAIELIRVWFDARLLAITGYTPNFSTDRSGQALVAATRYMFDFDSMALFASENGVYRESEIKFCRLLLEGRSLASLAAIAESEGIVATIAPTFASARTFYLPT